MYQQVFFTRRKPDPERWSNWTKLQNWLLAEWEKDKGPLTFILGLIILHQVVKTEIF